MSLSLGARSYIQTVSQWVDAHQWKGYGQQPTILVIQADTTQPEQYRVQSGFFDFEISASYTPGVDQLNDLTVSLNVPSFGPVLLTQQSTYSLSDSGGKNLTISVGVNITGNVSFKYVMNSDKKEVVSDYNVNIPYAGELYNSISIFPDDFQGIQLITTVDNPQSSNAKRSEGTSLLNTRDDESALLDKFFSDFVTDGYKILITSWNSDISKEYTFDVTFLGIFNVAGSINPGSLTTSGSLSLKLPFADNVRISDLNGSLLDGVTLNINTAIASGKATFTAEKYSSEQHDFYIDIDLNVNLEGMISSSKLNLLTLPF
ncbi:hypothetical protein OG21DRAFT_1513878 [Imleria badia]|nr:hypothetical protein OG21DRAFT_1513878 [Imleria badia]